MMEKFWELFEQSIIVQSLITLIVISGYTYMLVSGATVPDELNALATLILGFWFGSKAGYKQAVSKVRAQRADDNPVVE